MSCHDEITKLRAELAQAQKELAQAKAELAKLAGVMHDPAKPLSVERLVWRYVGGEGHGQLPQTWRDYAEQLEVEMDMLEKEMYGD